MSGFGGLLRSTVFGSKNQGGPSFDAECDVPSLTGKIILITGAAGDLGKQAAIEFARHDPARIYAADLPREDDGAAVINEIREKVPGANVSFLAIDLGSFESIKKAVAEFRAKEEKVDICVLNAGVLSTKPRVTKEGFEATFGINYLGHALFLRYLMPTLLHTATLPDSDVRVVVVSSEGHTMAPRGGITFDKLASPCEELSYLQRYGQSKVACIILARELARLHPQLTVVSIHPGRILTGMARGLRDENWLYKVTAPIAPLLCTSVEVGVRNHLWAATGKNVVSGKYYVPVGIPDHEAGAGKDIELSHKLWEWTENQFKEL